MKTLRVPLTLAALVLFGTAASAQVVLVPEPQPAPAPQTVAPPRTTPLPQTTFDDPDLRRNHQWTVSGFAGSPFGDAADEASVDFGGAVSYLWRQWVGGEFIATFSPDFHIAGAGEANVNSYMANAIGAVPLGRRGQWQPYVSGGVGGLSLRNAEEFLEAPDQSSWGSNVGAGFMGFADHWGFRADVRYYDQFGDVSRGGTLLDELDFWRANVGFAYRW